MIALANGEEMTFKVHGMASTREHELRQALANLRSGNRSTVMLPRDGEFLQLAMLMV
jgi:hypothetical protein